MPFLNIPDDIPKITPPQYNYIVGLIIDLGIFDTRKAYYKEYIGKEDLDSFTIGEADKLIQLLKKWKEDRNDR